MLPGDMFKGMPKMTPEMSAQMEQEMQAHRGDHQLDDAAGAREPSDHQRVAPQTHREGQRTNVKDVNRLLKQYVEMQR